MPNLPSSMPSGSKLWLLNLGGLDTDASNVLSGANNFKYDLPPQKHSRRSLIMISALIYHANFGLILFDVGACEDIIANWDQQKIECLPRTWKKEIHGLPEAIRATGAGEITDVKAVVLSHLHFDHAGGLEHFFGTDVEIWCHEAELKNAFWTCATGVDKALYLPHYLRVELLNWKTFSQQTIELWQGITLHRCPGHTDGSLVMEVELEMEGTVVMTGDLFHVKENYEDGRPQGPLMRDYNEWHRSRDYVRHLVRRKGARVLLGHESEYFEAFKRSPEFLE